MSARARIAVFASGEGHTLQALIDASAANELPADIALLVTNASRCGAVRRATNMEIAVIHRSRATHHDDDELDAAILSGLREAEIEFIVLAGYLKKLGPRTLDAFGGRAINTHPALLPLFGGAGMYGGNVHTAVLHSGARVSGASIHYVTSHYDTGPVIAQSEVAIVDGETSSSLEAKVKAAEQELLIEVLTDLVDANTADLTQLQCPTGYVIQPASPRHLHAADAIELAAGAIFPKKILPSPWRERTTPLLELEDACAERRLWVALTHQDVPVGFALTCLVDGAPHLQQMDVHPEHARRGIGAALVRYVLEHARQHHAQRMTLTTFANVVWNAPFYARTGFRNLDASNDAEALAASTQLSAILNAQRAGGLTNRVAMLAELRQRR